MACVKGKAKSAGKQWKREKKKKKKDWRGNQ